jgi:hypothetical protein
LVEVALQDDEVASNGDVTGQFAAVALQVPVPESNGCVTEHATQVLVAESQPCEDVLHDDCVLTSHATVELLNHSLALHGVHSLDAELHAELAAAHACFWLVSHAPVSGFCHLVTSPPHAVGS